MKINPLLIKKRKALVEKKVLKVKKVKKAKEVKGKLKILKMKMKKA